MPQNIPALHCPVYMQVLADPAKDLLSYISDLPMTTQLCNIHADKTLMSKAVKVTTVIHEVYPTESDQLGYYVDNDHFSFEGTSTIRTQSLLKEQKKKILSVARVAGMELQYEHNLYDAKIQQRIDPPFSANWFETPARFYEAGPPLLHMPLDIIQIVEGNRTLALEEKHEKHYQLTIADMTE